MRQASAVYRVAVSPVVGGTAAGLADDVTRSVDPRRVRVPAYLVHDLLLGVDENRLRVVSAALRDSVEPPLSRALRVLVIRAVGHAGVRASYIGGHLREQIVSELIPALSELQREHLSRVMPSPPDANGLPSTNLLRSSRLNSRLGRPRFRAIYTWNNQNITIVPEGHRTGVRAKVAVLTFTPRHRFPPKPYVCLAGHISCTLCTQIKLNEYPFSARARRHAVTNAAAHVTGATALVICIYNNINVREYKFMFIIIFAHDTAIFDLIPRSIFYKFTTSF